MHMETSCIAIRLAGSLMIAVFATSVEVTAQGSRPDLARGKAVYEHHCQSCHGPKGHGDGPAGESLKVRPADFHRFASFLKSDEEYLRTIEHGVVFSPMHAWRGELNDDEMTDVVAYIRLFAQQGP